MVNQEKLAFLQTGMFEKLQAISADTQGNWGVMTAQEMLEHAADFFNVSSGKLHFDLAVPEEYLPKYREFLFSEKDFKENTKAPASVLGEQPLPLRTANVAAALAHLQASVADFITYFQQNANSKTLHPAFGLLNFEEWVQLHHKHMRHHLKQFGLVL